MDKGQRGTRDAAEVSQQSKVGDNCGDQAPSVSKEERMTCSVKEQPPSQETSQAPGEPRAAAAVISVRGKNQLSVVFPDLTMTFGISAYDLSINILFGGRG